METIDLSHLSRSPARQFKKAIRLGKEEGRLEVLFHKFGSKDNPIQCRIFVWYHGPKRPREFHRICPLEGVPAHLTRGLVRLGATDAFLRLLQEAYEEILISVSGVRPDQLHEDNPEYDF